MIDASLFEGNHPARASQHSAMCLGTITEVNPAARLCTVKTISHHKHLHDKHIDKCQWLNWDASPAGDEATSVPRRGSIGVVVFIMGEPYIFGYIKGLNQANRALTGKEPANLTEGDKVISTQGGNRFTVKSSGLIEIFVKDTLKTLYLPGGSQLINFCRNYELKADAGFWQWSSDPKTFACLSRQVFRKDIAQSLVVLEEKGSTGSGMIHTSMGPGAALGAISLYDHLVDDTGKSTWAVGPASPTVTMTMDPGGTFEVKAAQDVTVESTAGHIQVHATALDVAVLADAGDVDLEATAGKVALNGSLAKLKLQNGMVGLGSSTAELLDLFNQTLQLFGKALAAIGQITHVGNLGYSTSPPVNLPDFVQLQTQVIQVQTLLQGIMGGI